MPNSTRKDCCCALSHTHVGGSAGNGKESNRLNALDGQLGGSALKLIGPPTQERTIEAR
jgi:hypothetical protein